MLCAEVQEQIAGGRTGLMGGLAVPAEADDEMRGHVAKCAVCRTALKRAIRRRYWYRPGPRAFVRTLRLLRAADRLTLEAPHDHSPIARVANTFLREAILQPAGALELRHESAAPYTGEDDDTTPPAVERADDARAGAFAADLATYRARLAEDTECMAVRICTTAGWRTTHRLPLYVAPAIRARYKSLAGVLVCREDIEQSGEFTVQSEGCDYRIQLATSPDPGGERLLLGIAGVTKAAES